MKFVIQTMQWTCTHIYSCNVHTTAYLHAFSHCEVTYKYKYVDTIYLCNKNTK